MDNVGSELAKPAREMNEFSLGGSLDAALRASSAQYDAPDQINRLRIKLDTSQQNDNGICTSFGVALLSVAALELRPKHTLGRLHCVATCTCKCCLAGK